MNYQEFLTTIKTQLSLRIDADATLDIRRFTKNNGTDLDGLIIFRPNLNISPTIYLNPYYHRYLQGVPMEDIYTDILITYQEHLPEEDIDVSFFTDFAKAKKLVTMRLVNYKQNEKMLQEVPHFRYHDLAVIFYCLLHANEENNAHILIDSQFPSGYLENQERRTLSGGKEKHTKTSPTSAYAADRSIAAKSLYLCGRHR